MTLLRQLVIVIVTLFILLFIGTLLLSINNTREYLNDQLRTISQDTATSLGLTLTPPMVEEEEGEVLEVGEAEEIPAAQHLIPEEPAAPVAAPLQAAAPRFATTKFDDITGDDELVLDNAFEATPTPAAPPEPEAPKVAGGGTLFERMSQLARGQTRQEEGEESDNDRAEFEVPRFLNRQNNQ